MTGYEENGSMPLDYYRKVIEAYQISRRFNTNPGSTTPSEVVSDRSASQRPERRWSVVQHP